MKKVYQGSKWRAISGLVWDCWNLAPSSSPPEYTYSRGGEATESCVPCVGSSDRETLSVGHVTWSLTLEAAHMTWSLTLEAGHVTFLL